MRTLLIFIIWLLPSLAIGTIPEDPDFTFRWSGFHSVIVVDSFAIGATDNGLVVLKRGTGDSTFQPVTNIFLPTPPREQKLFDTTLVIRNSADQLYLFDVSHLPNLERLGTLDIDIPYNDFVLDDSTLYTSRDFEGIWRYRIRNHTTAIYLDSNVTGIKYSDLAISGDTLFALDDYNGILFFKLHDTAVAKFLDYLYIPFEASSFALSDSGMVIALYDTRLFLADIGSSPPQITDTIELLLNPYRIFVSSDIVIVADSGANLWEGVSLGTGDHVILNSDEAPVGSIYGTIANFDNLSHMLYPSSSGGIMAFPIQEFMAGNLAVEQFVPRSSRVTGLAMIFDNLFVGGRQDPVDVFSISPSGEPSLTRTLFSGLDQVSAITSVRDSLFISYPQLRRTAVVHVWPDSTIYRGGLILDTANHNRIIFNPFKIDTLRFWFAVGDTHLRAYTITDSGYIDIEGSISTLSSIYDIALIDSILAVSTTKGLFLYRMFQDFTFEFRGAFAAEYTVKEILAHFGKMLVFDELRLKVVDVRNSFAPVTDTTIAIPVLVTASTVEGDFLYTVGDLGIAVFDISGPIPVLKEHGGRGGSLIAVKNGIAAISDGFSVHIYDLRNIVTDVDEPFVELPRSFELRQNYPNPFNPSTTIRFSLSERSRVTLTVFNMLGQEVFRLIDDELPAGRHEAVWNGTDHLGRQAATGLYLYRLATDEAVETRKMLLLK